MYLIKRKSDFKPIGSFLKFYSFARKSHYEVLNLRRNCTDKEIKEAYIQLSKEFHPDKNKDSQAQEKFVRIVEAYNVLGKPGARAQYDNTIEISSNMSAPSYVYKTHVPYNLRNNPQYNYFYEGPKRANAKSKAYYSAPTKKVPKYVIILMCLGLTFFGVIMQVFVVKELYMSHRQQSLRRSQYLAEELEKVRAAAQEVNNQEQTRLLLEKIVTAANPTVATASLGQALANEKK